MYCLDFSKMVNFVNIGGSKIIQCHFVKNFDCDKSSSCYFSTFQICVKRLFSAYMSLLTFLVKIDNL